MKLLILFFISFNLYAGGTMYKLLVESPDGTSREIVEVTESGYYYEITKVLWDERKDGLLEYDKDIQGATRIDGKIVFSQSQKDKHTLKTNEKNALISSKRARKQQVLNKLNLTSRELKDLLSDEPQ